MNTLLIFFAFPIAVIIFSVILQRLLHSPLTVAAIIFAIFIIVTFAAFDQNFLIATLAYTILAFITALLICRLYNGNNNNCNSNVYSSCNLCNAFSNTLEDIENNSNTNTNNNIKTTSVNDDNVFCNNTGYMYNRRHRRF